MKIVIAMDSLKGSLPSLEAGNAVREGILRAMPNAQVIVRPLADGGEGTVEALTLGMGGKLAQVNVSGPMGHPTLCTYGVIEKNKTAVVEMSGAAGITLVPEQSRDPLLATTYGVGEVIWDAIAKGCRRFIVGIGGSATNDGGIGMLQALGFGMLDENSRPVGLGAKGLKSLETITSSHVAPELKECQFRVACDVANVLCGEQGCSAVYGPQKGATPEMILEMDQWLARYASLTCAKYPKANPKLAGTGAAGGLGFAFLSYMDATLEPGVHIVLEETNLADYVKGADLVVTGEGQLDGQTIFGKAPIGVAKMAKQFHKKVLAFCGCATEDAIACNSHGIDAFFPILQNVQTRREAMEAKNAKKNLMAAAEQVFRLIQSMQE